MRPERQPQIWRNEAGSRRWLSALIDTMEDVARPEIRREPVAPETLTGLRTRLARPRRRSGHPKTRPCTT
jgi:hypothetical protein